MLWHYKLEYLLRLNSLYFVTVGGFHERKDEQLFLHLEFLFVHCTYLLVHYNYVMV